MLKLSKDSLYWSIKHFSIYPDTNVIPYIFEYKVLNYFQDDFKKYLHKKDILQWSTRPLRRCLVPKHRYGFRIVTQLDPIDAIIYSSLIYEIGEYIEKKRIPITKNVVFSHRFSPSSKTYSFFNPNINFQKFQKQSYDLALKYPFVLVTDIADFFPRIYLHRIENALYSCCANLSLHAKAITSLIKSWNQNVSYGIPIGNDMSKLLAELVINDIDLNLLSKKVIYCRYVDDYRIFCPSKQKAYQCLTDLANLLYDAHGLTLQSHKTRIFTSEEFILNYFETPERKEIKKLAENFETILKILGLDDPYKTIDYNSLPEEIKRQIDGLNLGSLLYQQINSEEIDLSMTKFLLNRLGQTKQLKPLKIALKKTEKLYPVFSEVIQYILNVSDVLSEEQYKKIGIFLLKLLSNSVVSHLPYHRMRILSLFAGCEKWGNIDEIHNLYDTEKDEWAKRCIILALGKAKQDFWFRAHKAIWQQLPPWPRRAFLYGAACLQKDERRHWYRAIESKLDLLEKFIVQFQKENTA